jgi:hypothetical protein
MLIIKIQGKEITNETKRMIEEYKVGGIILYRKNYDTYEEMINLINEIKKVNNESGNIPLFISIDQEGGRVNRMPRELKNIKSAGKLVAKDNNRQTSRHDRQQSTSAEKAAGMLGGSVGHKVINEILGDNFRTERMVAGNAKKVVSVIKNPANLKMILLKQIGSYLNPFKEL